MSARDREAGRQAAVLGLTTLGTGLSIFLLFCGDGYHALVLAFATSVYLMLRG